MPAPLKDHQFEIMRHDHAADGFLFGIGTDLPVEAGGFKPGEQGWIVQDTENSRRGTVNFGRDARSGGAEWTWEAFTNKEDPEGALRVLDLFTSYWGRHEVYGEGRMQRLRYRVAGRERCIFGRPRRYSAPPNNMILNGLVPVSFAFKPVDAFTYSDEEHTETLRYYSDAVGGGMVFPVTFPIDTMPSEGLGAATISVDGNARSYPRIRFKGPWTNPSINAGRWKIQWTGSIPINGWVEVDARPWALTAKNQSGASVAGGLTHSTWLEDCWLAPGEPQGFQLGGSSPGGGAECDISWRDAWTTW